VEGEEKFEEWGQIGKFNDTALTRGKLGALWKHEMHSL
jgi:hypothetical protein